MKLTEEIYGELRRMGFVENREQLSERWFRREKSYLRSLKSKQRKPSETAITECAKRLQSYADYFANDPNERSAMFARRLNVLADRCWEEIGRTG